MERFERIGLTVMNRAQAGGPMGQDVSGAVLGDGAKRRMAAQILGQAFVTAVACMRHNREAVAQVAEVLVRARRAPRRRGRRAPRAGRPRGAGDRRPRRRDVAAPVRATPDDRDRAEQRARADPTTPRPAPRPRTRPGRGRSTIPPRSSPRMRRRGRRRPRSSTATPSSSARARARGRRPAARAAPRGRGRAGRPPGGRAAAPRVALQLPLRRAGGARDRGGGRAPSWRWRAAAGTRTARSCRGRRGGPRRAPSAAPARSPTTSQHRYRLAAAPARAGPGLGLDFEGIPLTVALRETPAQGGDIRVFNGDGLIYRCAGWAPTARSTSGKPSTQRLLLLRREALELALYSFRYLDVDRSSCSCRRRRRPSRPRRVFFRRGTSRRSSAAR